VRILAFDTATAATTVALCDVGTAPVEARDDPEPGTRPRHTTRLMSLIAEVLDRGSCSWDRLDRIAVGVGPGTFTGLRIGVSTARALARARGIALVGVSTLESLALGAAGAARDGAVVAVLDARRGEVFAAAWETSGPALGRRLLDPVALAPETLASTAARVGARRLMIGDGAVAFRPVLEGSGTTIPDDRSRLHSVDAIYHCRLASGPAPATGGDVRPEYLRLPDAELSYRAAGTR
jgi:tRNA threonylcarbamoyladenosine biosynthesis protein TsaB